jgi:hypothetical protein
MVGFVALTPWSGFTMFTCPEARPANVTSHISARRGGFNRLLGQCWPVVRLIGKHVRVDAVCNVGWLAFDQLPGRLHACFIRAHFVIADG